MIIEFAGLPGAGKSTIADQFFTTLEAEGVDPVAASSLAVGSGPFYLGRLRSVVRHGRFVAAVAWVACRSPRALQDRWLWFRMVMVMLHRFDVARSMAPLRPVIFDEGIVQRAFLALVEADRVGSVSEVGQYLRHAPRPDVVVLLQVDPETCLARIAGRTRGVPNRLSGLSDDALGQRLAEAAWMIEQSLQRLVADGTTRVVRLDGSADDVLEQVVNTVGVCL